MDSPLKELVIRVASFAVILALFAHVMRKKNSASTVYLLPVPPLAHCLWGHEMSVFLRPPGHAFRDWINEIGLTFRIKASLKAPDILVIGDPLAISYIMQRRIFDYHHSAIVRPRVGRFLGRSLGWIEGESEHRRMKKVVSPSLTAATIKAFASDLQDASARVLHNLVNTVQSTSTDGGIINILPWTNKATLNVIGRVAFLHDFEEGESIESKNILQARQKGVSTASRSTNFLVQMFLRRFAILNNLPIAALQAQGAVKLAIQSGVAKEMIKRNEKSAGISINADHQDLLSSLLVALREQKLSASELYEHISTFIIAGQETTSQTIAFSVLELSRHPMVQNRLRLELQTIEGEATYDDFLTKLPYLDAVLKETLRMYPPLPYFERVSTKLDVIPLRYPVRLSNGNNIQEVRLGPGQTVIIPTISLQRLDLVWEDGEVFRPERWLGALPPQEKLCSGWSNLLAFSDGPRTCPGQRLAMFEYKVILSDLITKFQINDAGLPMTYSIASSLQPFVKGREGEGPQIPVKLTLL